MVDAVKYFFFAEIVHRGNVIKKAMDSRKYAKLIPIDSVVVESVKNLTLSCRKCNIKKSNLTLKEFGKKAKGRGSRQMCLIDRFGFPITKAKGSKVVILISLPQQQPFKVSIINIVQLYKKEMAMPIQYQILRNNKLFQFLLPQIEDYGRGILGDRG